MRNNEQARLLILGLLAVGAAVPAMAQPGKLAVTEFDAPGAGTVTSQVCANAFLGFLGCGTIPLANNDQGEVVGTYSDANNVQHAFLRTSDGSIVAFDVRGAGTEGGQGTVAYAVNDLGVIAGGFQDANNVYHGFVLYPNGYLGFATGHAVVFDVPGAGTGANQGTLATSINQMGGAAGTYIDGNGVNHGFYRSYVNEFTSFDPPGSVFTYPCEETCLSRDGAITGFYLDANNTAHGFLRTPDGTITTIDAPGAGTGNGLGTVAASINTDGMITGYVADANNVAHGFVLRPDGSLVLDDDPAASANAGAGTAAFSINILGATTGMYVDDSGVLHGFERDPVGGFANFDAPHAGTGAGQGTRPSTNNSWGSVAGWYIDGNGVNHGFVWKP